MSQTSSVPNHSPHPAQRIKLKAVVILLNIAAIGALSVLAWNAWRRPLAFDDAFMFLRYALHLREGIGISWNPDAVHTAGLTSMGWLFAVIPMSFLPIRQGQPLALESFTVGVIGLAGLAWCISNRAAFPPFRRFWVVFPLITLPLVCLPPFSFNMTTGMDTMMSFAANGALCCGLWLLCTSAGANRGLAALIGLLGVFTFIVRPENGAVAVGAPIAAAFLLLPQGQRSKILWTVLTFSVGIAAYLVWYRTYFHTLFPLGFYMKSQHAYRGYIGAGKWSPERFLMEFSCLALPFLAFPLLTINRRTIRIAIVYLLPVAIVFAYLQTVLQIMGSKARYYVPFIAPVIVGAFWMADIALASDWRSLARRRLPRVPAYVIAAVILVIFVGRPIESLARRGPIVAYAAPGLQTYAKTPLPPVQWFNVMTVLANRVIKPLPPGSYIAVSEVGMIGAIAPNIGVIDLAGLNDRDIALNGFNVDRLLDRKPLFIWFPHADYTRQRQVMLCSARLLREYTLIGGDAFNYSVAIRRGAEQTAELNQSVTDAFKQLYPGFQIANYVVNSVDCREANTTEH